MAKKKSKKVVKHKGGRRASGKSKASKVKKLMRLSGKGKSKKSKKRR